MTRVEAPERLLTEEEAANMLGIEKEALARLRRAGRAPVHTRVGRFPKYARKHIIAYLGKNVGGVQYGR